MKYHQGFTLLELAVVMAIMAVIAALSTPSIVNEINEKRSRTAVDETQQIVDAARTYRAKTGAWPGTNNCLNAIAVLTSSSPAYLIGISGTNKFNSAISTSCTAYTFSVDQNIVADWDGYLANELPATTIVNASTHQIRTTVGIPGSEPALDSKLSRLATGNAELNRMRTDLLMGNNNISEVNTLNAAQVVASTTIQAGGRITGASLYSNNELSVSGNSWTGGSAQVNGNVLVGSSLQVNGNQVTYGSTHTNGNAIVNGTVSATDVSINGTGYVQPGAAFNLANVQTENTPCGRNGDLARASTGKILSCNNGTWSGGGGFTGKYYFQGLYTRKASGTNSSSNPIFVNSHGGNGHASTSNSCYAKACGNTCYLQGYSGGMLVAHDANNDGSNAKSCSIGFWVAPNSSWEVVSEPYMNANGGTFIISLFGQP